MLRKFGFCLAILIVTAASAANAASQDAVASDKFAQVRPLYNYNQYPDQSPGYRGCYMPSDGCLSEYSVQN
jgi:hypothetical protein